MASLTASRMDSLTYQKLQVLGCRNSALRGCETPIYPLCLLIWGLIAAPPFRGGGHGGQPKGTNQQTSWPAYRPLSMRKRQSALTLIVYDWASVNKELPGPCLDSAGFWCSVSMHWFIGMLFSIEWLVRFKRWNVILWFKADDDTHKYPGFLCWKIHFILWSKIKRKGLH